MAREWINRWTPPAVRRAANGLLGASIRYRGPYPDLAQARQRTTGYGEAGILSKVEAATREVLAGNARYEQDGRAFTKPAPADPAMAGLLLGVARGEGRLSVLDFGGSLGSHYLRWSHVLSQLDDLQWCVVEQPHFVEAGRQLHAHDERLHFESDLAAASRHRPNLVLASGVLQFMDSPYATLASLAEIRAEVLIIDRTPFCVDGEHRFYSQHVPRQLQRASYPLQALSREAFEHVLLPSYALAFEYLTADEPIDVRRTRAIYRGSVWLLRHEYPRNGKPL